MGSAIIKRSVVINARKTSVSLEDEFWNALKDIASNAEGHAFADAERNQRRPAPKELIIGNPSACARLLYGACAVTADCPT